MAWTKPLVRQQAENIIRDAGIPSSEMGIVTAEEKTHVRHLNWREKRFFSAIPQCVKSDIDAGHINMERIKLVIV